MGTISGVGVKLQWRESRHVENPLFLKTLSWLRTSDSDSIIKQKIFFSKGNGFLIPFEEFSAVLDLCVVDDLQDSGKDSMKFVRLVKNNNLMKNHRF